MADEPTLTPIGDSIWLHWTTQQLTLEFSRFHDHRDTLSAEVSIVSTALGSIHWARVNLASTQGRNALVKGCEEVAPGLPWREVIDRSCRLVAAHLRKGEPSIALTSAPPQDNQWLVDGLILKDQLNVLYADGGTGKSYLALAIALSGLLRRAISSRWRVNPLKRVLYLDWECGADTQRARLWRLEQGLQSAPADGLLRHRTMRRPLIDMIESVRGEVARHDVDLVIADSLAPACGNEPETASSIVPALLALRSLATTVIILAHISNQSVQSKGPTRPFGSVFVYNLARSTIEARRSDPDGDQRGYVLSLYHRKNNEGQLAPPSALQLTFDVSGAVRLGGALPDSGGASLSFQILEALKAGKAKPGHLAEMLDAETGSIKKALQRLANRDMVVALGDSSGGKGKEQEWALVVRNRDTNRDSDDNGVPVREPGDEDTPF